MATRQFNRQWVDTGKNDKKNYVPLEERENYAEIEIQVLPTSFDFDRREIPDD